MIFLLEDDESIRKLVVYALQSQGFEAEGFAEPTAFWEKMRKECPGMTQISLRLNEISGKPAQNMLKMSKRSIRST